MPIRAEYLAAGLYGHEWRAYRLALIARRGQFFATRASARQIISEEIDTLSQREAVILDWEGVQAVTGAFAAEVAKWYLSAGRRVASTGMNSEVRETYETACRRESAAREGAADD